MLTLSYFFNLEKRIENVEYYTQLSLLETQAQSLQIQDANGFDRFKNGFVVDNFTGHNVGDVGNNDYKLAIDRAKKLFNANSSIQIKGYQLDKNEKKLFKFKNCLGEGWGDDGYGYLPYDYLSMGLMGDLWTITDTI